MQFSHFWHQTAQKPYPLGHVPLWRVRFLAVKPGTGYRNQEVFRIGCHFPVSHFSPTPTLPCPLPPRLPLLHRLGRHWPSPIILISTAFVQPSLVGQKKSQRNWSYRRVPSVPMWAALHLLIIIWLSKTSVRGKRSARIADLSLSHVILIDSKRRSVAPMCSLVRIADGVCLFSLTRRFGGQTEKDFFFEG